jgi:hypothetical protein
MVSTKDKLLTDCHFSGDISWNEFIRDCETAINTPELHLNECLSNDEDIAQEERDYSLSRHILKPDGQLYMNVFLQLYDLKFAWKIFEIIILKLFQLQPF